jgi:hypothetical protein
MAAPLLPRFYASNLKAENAARVAKIVADAAGDDTANPEQPAFRGDALLVDRERLRGIPAIGPGVRGAIAGTNPLHRMLSDETRRERRQ